MRSHEDEEIKLGIVKLAYRSECDIIRDDNKKYSCPYKIGFVADDHFGNVDLPDELQGCEKKYLFSLRRVKIPILVFRADRGNHMRNKFFKWGKKFKKPFILLYPDGSSDQRDKLCDDALKLHLDFGPNVIIFSYRTDMSPVQKAVFYHLLENWDKIPYDVTKYFRDLDRIYAPEDLFLNNKYY